jgi:L-alanine-DL-glutamate epimerase-like enolase superfamily enzyme
MKIIKVETNLYNIPPKTVLAGGGTVATHFEAIVAKVFTDEGLEGYGYAYTLGLGGKAIKSLIDELSPLIIGTDPTEIETIWNKLWLICRPLGATGISQYAIAAIDVALWDIISKKDEKPLHQVLGGFTEELDVYVSGLFSNANIDDLKKEAETYLARNSSMKMRGGRGAKEDIKVFEEFRQWLGDDIQLMVEGNQGWSCQ